MDGNKLFESMNKIMQSEKRLVDDEILIESKSMTFIKIADVKKENLPMLMNDIDSLIEILDNAVVDFYQLQIGPDLHAKFEELVDVMKQKEAKLKYLSGFFVTTTEKIEAVKTAIEDYEKKIIEAEEKKMRLESRMKDARDRLYKKQTRRFIVPQENPRAPKNRFQAFARPRTVPEMMRHDIVLHLEPPQFGPQRDPALETISSIGDDEDWLDEEEEDDDFEDDME